ncbi:hypothetical protein VSH64_21130 [Amycolatopsis rhabdoformis]|uniref:Uncharacterized protein n=1 Tax=Amycolatopsis rhabdoformis TaxID=1448059 RepID=A0ABZ1IL15_9PSEU|nr:hypothetical protein [Amycolatopsis rhabdoformis]WSE34556.1 hypothetical protein VSH64_21130 [Amycolatopsis rhabdoformis]
MADQKSRPRDSYGALMLQAAGVLRLRYVKCGQDSSLSAAAASELADTFEGVAHGDPAFDQLDPKEAIALAHRLLDDDHPELSTMWPGSP